MSTTEFDAIMTRLDKIEKLVAKPAISEKWVDEEEAIKITGLCKESLRRRRKTNTFTWSSATGRKPKYLRKDLEDYITKNASR